MAMNQADKRIAALLARAGSPMMVVKAEPMTIEQRRKHAIALCAMIESEYGGDRILYELHNCHLIDRLEAALENALNERDQLMKDVTLGIICDCCVHGGECSGGRMCEKCDGRNRFEWRGVQDKEW